jgi:hypothetical protein
MVEEGAAVIDTLREGSNVREIPLRKGGPLIRYDLNQR